MKVIIVLSAIVACVVANDLGYGTSHYEAAPIVSKVLNVNNGHSTQYRKQDAWGNYAFGYDEQHHDAWGSGGSSRHEKSDAWNNKEGSYSLNVGDGRQRIVKYVADGAGFRASIKTNEPGIVASNPADANINTPHGGYDAAPLGHGIAAVATNVATYAAPLAYTDGLALNGGALAGHGLSGGYLGNAGLGYGNGAGLGY